MSNNDDESADEEYVDLRGAIEQEKAELRAVDRILRKTTRETELEIRIEKGTLSLKDWDLMIHQAGLIVTDAKKARESLENVIAQQGQLSNHDKRDLYKAVEKLQDDVSKLLVPRARAMWWIRNLNAMINKQVGPL